MKSNRGVTLTSLIIYVIGLVIVVAIINQFNGYFFGNVNNIVITNNANEEYSLLVSFLTKDTNNPDVYFVKSGDNYVYFKISENGNEIEHQYIFEDNKIYFIRIEQNNITKKIITLCENVTAIGKPFEYNNEKKVLNVNLTIEDKDYSLIYTLP